MARPRARRLSAGPLEPWLLGQAVLAMAAARLGLSVLSFGTFRRVFEIGPPQGPRRDATPADATDATPRAVIRAVTRAGRIVPRSTCLVQAVAARTLLTRRQQPAELRIGVARSDAGRLEAHAWLERDGRVILGGPTTERFAPLPALEGRSP
jgi:hypothetical protein